MTEEYVIDCDAAPFIPEGWSIREADQLKNRVRGTFIWDPAKVRLYLSQGLEGGRVIEGNELRKELKSERVLNANVLDYLLEPEHRHLIPAEWKKEFFLVFFWGTIYRLSDESLCVRALRWDNKQDWYWNYAPLESAFFSASPAAVRL